MYFICWSLQIKSTCKKELVIISIKVCFLWKSTNSIVTAVLGLKVIPPWPRCHFLTQKGVIIRREHLQQLVQQSSSSSTASRWWPRGQLVQRGEPTRVRKKFWLPRHWSFHPSGLGRQQDSRSWACNEGGKSHCCGQLWPSWKLRWEISWKCSSSSLNLMHYFIFHIYLLCANI